MSDTIQVFDGRLEVSYGMAYVISDGADDTSDFEAMFRGQANGMLGAALPGRLCLMTGMHTGDVDMRADVFEAEPPVEEGWEECVEVSFVPGPRVRLIDFWGEPFGKVCCELSLAAGDWRVRYQGRGMDDAHLEVVTDDDDTIDSYLLSFWPAPPAPDSVLKQTSETARSWHDWACALGR